MAERIEVRDILNDVRFIFFFLSVCIFLLFIIIDITAGPRWDVNDFYRVAENVKSGLIPYRDFQYEFPPFQLLFICFPIIFTDSLEIYSMIFSIMGCISCILTMFILVKIGEELNLDKILIMLSFAVIILIFSFCLSAKVDTFLILIITLAIYCYIKNRFALAVAVSVFGALFKITPLILTVLLFIMVLFTGNRIEKVRNVVKSIVYSLMVVVVAIVPFLCMNTTLEQVFSFIFQHSGRGIHIESTFGVIARFFNELGLMDITRTLNMGAIEINCEFCTLMVTFSIPIIIVLFACFIVFILLMLMKHGMFVNRNEKIKFLLLSYMILTLIFILCTKILSTQYVIWVLPAAILLALTPGSKKFEYKYFIWFVIFPISLMGVVDVNHSIFPFLFMIRLILMIFLVFDYFMDLYEMFNPDVFKTSKNTTVSE